MKGQMRIYNLLKSFILISASLVAGCVLVDETGQKERESNGLIITPPTYYSTAKARYLGARYKDNLDRLVEQITRNPTTATLQFANNISSVGGIGFFTHSATKTPDERYLEVVLATPETFEVKGEFNEKVQQLFGRYGVELLDIVSGDKEIYEDREMSGYGLNLAWRNVVTEPAGNRVTLERAILYFPKERVHRFVDEALDPSDLLSGAVIFAMEENGPLNLVSYRPQKTKPDVRAAIKEDALASASTTPRSPDAASKVAGPEQDREGPEAAQASANSKNDSREPAAAPEEAKNLKLPEPIVLPPPSAQNVEQGEPVKLNRTANSVDPSASSLLDPRPDTELVAPPAPASENERNAPLALLKELSAEGKEKLASAREAVKPLAGYIVQVGFDDKEKAQRWAETMVQRGYAVSLTEAGSEGMLRVRVGNFTGRNEAERHLQTFKLAGLKGIVISLPQSFRPAARTSMP